MSAGNKFFLAVMAGTLANVLGSLVLQMTNHYPVSIGGYQYANEASGFTYADEAAGFTYADDAPSGVCTPQINRQPNSCHSP